MLVQPEPGARFPHSVSRNRVVSTNYHGFLYGKISTPINDGLSNCIDQSWPF